MSFTLTVQQRAQRCRCGRYLAWWTIEHSVCCGCMHVPEDCMCAPTDNPAEGCHGIDFERVAEPDGGDPGCE
jgi:hypothetical protein